MKLRVGARYFSQVCSTQVIAVTVPASAGEIDLRCGGLPLAASPVTELQPLDESSAGGTLLGKRYTDGEIELLVVKPGKGTLTVGAEPLQLKQARELPSSD